VGSWWRRSGCWRRTSATAMPGGHRRGERIGGCPRRLHIWVMASNGRLRIGEQRSNLATRTAGGDPFRTSR
jgi:hypothetical protein